MKVSLTNWPGVFGMIGIWLASMVLLFLTYIFGWYDTTVGSVLIPLLAIFAVWTLVEIVIAILLAVRVFDGEIVSIGRKKQFKLADLEGLSVRDGSGKEMPQADRYKSPELVFLLSGNRTMSMRLSALTGAQLEALYALLGLKK